MHAYGIAEQHARVPSNIDMRPPRRLTPNIMSRAELKKRLQILRIHSPSILRGLGAFILFLVAFGLNKHIRVQPHLSDLDSVHVGTINSYEKLTFSFHLHKILSDASHPVLDVLAAIPYLLHYTIPFLFPLYLFLCDRTHEIADFYALLSGSCWFFYVIWWLFPHAPPWVMLDVSPSTPISATEPLLHDILHNVPDLAIALRHKEGTAFHRLDVATGTSFFYNLFTGSPVPFACFPSGHLAWSASVFLIGGPGGRFFGLYVIWMAWATMYSFHHYFIDALAGIAGTLVCYKWMQVFKKARTVFGRCSAVPTRSRGKLLLVDGTEFQQLDGPKSSSKPMRSLAYRRQSRSPNGGVGGAVFDLETANGPKNDLIVSEDFPPMRVNSLDSLDDNSVLSTTVSSGPFDSDDGPRLETFRSLSLMSDSLVSESPIAGGTIGTWVQQPQQPLGGDLPPMNIIIDADAIQLDNNHFPH